MDASIEVKSPSQVSVAVGLLVHLRKVESGEYEKVGRDLSDDERKTLSVAHSVVRRFMLGETYLEEVITQARTEESKEATHKSTVDQ